LNEMQDQMTVFISYSFDDQPDFENVADWLDNLSVPYWKPAEIKSGESLREQLREAAELVKQKDRSGTGSISPSDKLTNITVGQLEKIFAGAVSLVRASEDRGSPVVDQAAGPEDRALDAAGHVLRAADAASHIGREPGDVWRRRILWVDDRPDNNIYERQVFESLGFTFELALSTDEALERLKDSRYGAIISDMGRPEGPREGYRLLEAVRASDRVTPFFIYASSNRPEYKREAAERGAQGSTNGASELVELVTQALSSHDAGPL